MLVFGGKFCNKLWENWPASREINIFPALMAMPFSEKTHAGEKWDSEYLTNNECVIAELR